MGGRAAFAITHSLAVAKVRYAWATAWVQIKTGIWCFADPEDARAYQTDGRVSCSSRRR
jgi:hypothetical protein